jgi:hypothetical protein
MKVLLESPFTISDAHEQESKNSLSDLSKYNNKITKVDFFKLDIGSNHNSVLAEIQIHVPGLAGFLLKKGDKLAYPLNERLVTSNTLKTFVEIKNTCCHIHFDLY